MDIKVGGIVTLNSGSPELRVIKTENGITTVEWPGDGGEIQNANFPVSCLTVKAMQPVLQSSKRDRSNQLPSRE